MHILLACRPNDDVRKGETYGEVEATGLAFLHRIRRRGFDGEKIGELTSEQIDGLALEIVRQLSRHIGQSALGVGFPNPPAATVLKFINEVKRLARQRVQPQSITSGGDDLARSSNAIRDEHQRDDFAARQNDGRICKRDRGNGRYEHIDKSKWRRAD